MKQQKKPTILPEVFEGVVPNGKEFQSFIVVVSLKFGRLHAQINAKWDNLDAFLNSPEVIYDNVHCAFF